MSKSIVVNLPDMWGGAQDPVFSAPWEARAFAVVVKLHEAGHFTWTQWVEVLSAEIAHAEQDHTGHYYHCWLAAAEKLLKQIGLLTEETLAEAIEATLANWPHPDHVARREPVACDPGMSAGGVRP